MSFTRYESYKDSGVEWLGAIPRHWEAQRLKRLFEITKRIANGDGHDVLAVTQRGIQVKDLEANQGQFAEDYSKYQLVQPGDFVMNHMDLLTGFADVSKYHGVTSPDYRVFRLRRPAEHDSRFLLRVVQNAYRRKIFYAFGQGASHFGRWRLPTDAFNDFVVAVPPLAEQRALADFLDRETAKIDALVDEQRRLIELLKEKRQAVISHAVTKGLDPTAPMKDSGVEWLGQVPEHWEVLKGSSIGTLFGSEQVRDDQVSTQGTVPFLKVASLSAEGFDVASWDWYLGEEDAANLQIRANFLVFPKRGAAIFLNKVNVVSRPALIDPNLMGWAMRDVVRPRFMAYVLKTRQLQDLADVSTVPQINNKHIAPERFPAPPLDEQDAILVFLDAKAEQLNALVAEAAGAIRLLEERRTALISAAVTGKIDVRGAVPATAEAA